MYDSTDEAPQRTASTTTACSCKSFGEESNSSALLLSSTESSLRGLEPANGLEITCIPLRETSNSGLAPINVLLFSFSSFDKFTANVYPCLLCAANSRRSFCLSIFSEELTSNDLDRTIFLNPRPLFLQFLASHHSYTLQALVQASFRMLSSHLFQADLLYPIVIAQKSYYILVR